MIASIVFDFDGTLVDSNHIKRQTFYEVTKSYDPSGSTITHILKQFPDKDRYGIFQTLAQELASKDHPLDQETLATLATEWAKTYTVTCEKAITTCKEVPGTTETIRWITRQGIPIFINSRTPTETLKRLVTLRSLQSYMLEILGAPASKAENLRHIQRQTKSNPQAILFVGDSDDDREAALEVGCQFIGVVLNGDNRFSSGFPKPYITNLYQLQTIIKHFNDKGT